MAALPNYLVLFPKVNRCENEIFPFLRDKSIKISCGGTSTGELKIVLAMAFKHSSQGTFEVTLLQQGTINSSLYSFGTIFPFVMGSGRFASFRPGLRSGNVVPAEG